MTGSRDPRLSVVMPVHDVERFLPMALAALRAQTMADFEVVMVDDASGDASAQIAADVAATDSRFRLLHSDHRGPGVARNLGIAEAQGEFLTFVDSDDYVPRHAFEILLRTLEKTGSDFAAGNARRFDLTSVWRSWGHAKPFARTRLATTIAEHPLLISDRTPWGKIYRRDFWDRTGLAFPDMLYEDFPVNVAAYAAARQLDVVHDTVYYWRVRDGATTSITQQHWRVANMADRVRSAAMVLDIVDRQIPFVGTQAREVLLDTDLLALVRSVEDHDGAEREAVLDLANDFIERIGPRYVADRDPFERVAVDLVRRRRGPELVQLIRHLKRYRRAAPLVEREGRFYQALPWFEDPVAGVPLACYEVDPDELTLEAVVDDAWWIADGLTLEVDVDLGSMLLDRDTPVRAWFEHADGTRVEPATKRLRRERPGLGVDHSRLRLRVRRLGRLADAAPGGLWTLRVAVAGPTGVEIAGAADSRRGRERWLGSRPCSGGRWAAPQTSDGAFGLAVRRPPQWVLRCTDLGDELEVVGGLRGTVTEPAYLLLEGAGGRRVTVPVAVAPDGDGASAFTAMVPVKELIDQESVGLALEEQSVFTARLVVGDDQRRLAGHPDFLGAVGSHQGRDVAATLNPQGFLVFTESPARVWVDDLQWTGPAELTLRGACVQDGSPAGVVLLRHWLAPEEPLDVRLPVRQRNGLFTVTVDVAHLVDLLAKYAVEAHDRGDKWHLLTDTEEPTALRMHRSRMGEGAGTRTVGGRSIKPRLDRADELQLIVR